MQADAETLKQVVRESYGAVARGDLRTGGDVVAYGELLGYQQTDMAGLGEANLGLGCGSPLSFEPARRGETVLDLGSGAGFDAFVARRAVGGTGRVIGVDMTPDMLEKARANAAELHFDNVEFRHGEIEALPVESDSVDLVISNCVLNLVPDKAAAFAEIARVLKPGGRLCVSDIVRVGELPPGIAESLTAYSACGAGAVPRDEYLGLLAAVGLGEIRVLKLIEAREVLTSSCCNTGLEELPAGCLASLTVRASKPARRVLFLCTGNSCRSQIAEGWLRTLGGSRYAAYSAGLSPHGLNASAVQVMAEVGVDLSGHLSESLERYADQPFDDFITVCDRARESCPVTPPGSRTLHWSFDDPPTLVREQALEGEAALDVYRRVRDEIRVAVAAYLARATA